MSSNVVVDDNVVVVFVNTVHNDVANVPADVVIDLL